MEETFEEYKDWLQDEADSYTKQMYLKAQAKLEKIKPYEDKLVSLDGECYCIKILWLYKALDIHPKVYSAVMYLAGRD